MPFPSLLCYFISFIPMKTSFIPINGDSSTDSSALPAQSLLSFITRASYINKTHCYRLLSKDVMCSWSKGHSHLWMCPRCVWGRGNSKYHNGEQVSCFYLLICPSQTVCCSPSTGR